MIDINKFENLANEIVANSNKENMLDWFENYRNKQALFVNFKSIEGKFKMEPSNMNFNSKNSNSPATGYSIAA